MLVNNKNIKSSLANNNYFDASFEWDIDGTNFQHKIPKNMKELSDGEDT